VPQREWSGRLGADDQPPVADGLLFVKPSFGLLAIGVLSTEETESHRLQPLDAIQKPDV
jgi:hypothetical protein